MWRFQSIKTCIESSRGEGSTVRYALESATTFARHAIASGLGSARKVPKVLAGLFFRNTLIVVVALEFAGTASAHFAFGPPGPARLVAADDQGIRSPSKWNCLTRDPQTDLAGFGTP